MDTEVTRNELIAIAKNLIEKKCDGTIFVRTETNRSIVISIDSGEIVTLFCGSKRGEQVVPMIREIVKCTYRLHDTVISYEHLGARPASNESLLFLLLDDTGHDQTTCDWVRDVLCKVLATYMGPIAPVLCRQAISTAGGVDSQDKVTWVVNDLALEIDDADEAQRFKTEVRMELGRRS